jgi:hypothetical protein
MRTILLLVVAALLLSSGVILWWVTRGPDVAQFADIREPRFARLNDQRMLVVEATGDPNVVGASAFNQLFSAYYKLEGVSRRGQPPAPRARWPKPMETPRDQWLGRYALPVPDSATAPPAESSGPLRTTIAMWEYGDVAEVLHVGSYSTEVPDIERLCAFITSRGRRVVGDHEEEYVKGPGMFFAGNPDNYLTIIRLRVEQTPIP